MEHQQRQQQQQQQQQAQQALSQGKANAAALAQERATVRDGGRGSDDDYYSHGNHSQLQQQTYVSSHIRAHIFMVSLYPPPKL